MLVAVCLQLLMAMALFQGAVPASTRLARILFVSLEYNAATFSGNGVHAQAQVKGLRRAGHRLLVVCAAPHQLFSDARVEVVDNELTIITVRVCI
jgi:hypothetical protein